MEDDNHLTTQPPNQRAEAAKADGALGERALPGGTCDTRLTFVILHNHRTV